MAKESIIQKNIIDFCKHIGALPIKTIVCNESGFPDLIIPLPNGITAYIEAKTPDGKPTALQTLRNKQLTERNQPAIIAYSFEEAKDFLLKISNIPPLCKVY